MQQKEATDALAVGLRKNYGAKVEVRYIDTDREGLGAFPEVAKVIRRGFSLPVIFINGEPRAAGRIELGAIRAILDKMSKL